MPHLSDQSLRGQPDFHQATSLGITLCIARTGGLPRYELVFHCSSRNSGASFSLPDKEFRYLRTVHIVTDYKSSRPIPFSSPCRHGGRTISSISFLLMVWRIVSEDSIMELLQFTCDSGIDIADLLPPLWPFLLIICTGQIFTSNYL